MDLGGQAQRAGALTPLVEVGVPPKSDGVGVTPGVTVGVAVSVGVTVGVTLGVAVAVAVGVGV